MDTFAAAAVANKYMTPKMRELPNNFQSKKEKQKFSNERRQRLAVGRRWRRRLK
jgi:hypothetical protein